MSKKINGIDYIDRINDLNLKFESTRKALNFMVDEVSEFRKAVNAIQTDIHSEITKAIREGEKSLLIDCYTIAEQMIKDTKYQKVDFDETENTAYQKFLCFKINPEKFSPNPKFEEIGDIFKRYDSSRLFLLNPPVYEKMINARHRYAHSGRYQFDFESIPKIIEILLYLEFECRMFLENSSWCQLSLTLKSINNIKGNSDIKQTDFNEKYSEIEILVKDVERIISDEQNIIIENISPIIALIKNRAEFKKIYIEIKKVKNTIKDKYL